MPDRPLPASWRRWLRLSVRALMVLVLITGGGLGWMLHRARVQRDAVAVLQRAGGQVTYDWEWANGMPVPYETPLWPRWLVDAIGIDCLSHVIRVCGSLKFTD